MAITFLQHVDDSLLGAKTEQECKIATTELLKFLGTGWISSISEEGSNNTDHCNLGFELSQGKRELGTERKAAICLIAPPPWSKRERQGFLGKAGTL